MYSQNFSKKKSKLDDNPFKDAFVGYGPPNSRCELSEEGGVLVMEHGLDECETDMEYDSENDKIKFTVSFRTNYREGTTLDCMRLSLYHLSFR